MSSLHIRLLGRPSVLDSTQKSITIPAKAKELFYYLLIHYHRPHEREALAAQLWPDVSSDRSKKYFRHALWQLQSSLGESSPPDASMLVVDNHWIHLQLEPCIWLDVHRFQESFHQVKELPVEALGPEQAAGIQKSIALYQGDLLTGWYQDWCLLERVQCQSMFLSLLDKLVDYCLVQRQLESGIDYAMQILRCDIARELTHQRLMYLYYLANNRTAALRQFEQCCDALKRELDVGPSRQTVSLYHQIQADDVADLEGLKIPTASSDEQAPTELLGPREGDPQPTAVSHKEDEKSYSTQFKVKVMRALLGKEKDISKLADVYNVSVTQLSAWEQEALDKLPKLFQSEAQDKNENVRQLEKEKESLYAEIGRLTMQLKQLKQSRV